MIIKFQVKNNRYTQIIEDFLNTGGIFNIRYFDTKEELEEFKKAVNSIRNYKYCSSSKEDVKPALLKTIKKVFNNYLAIIENDTNWKTEQFTYKDLPKIKQDLQNTEIQLVNLIMDKAFNKERIYYLDFINSYIIL